MAKATNKATETTPKIPTAESVKATKKSEKGVDLSVVHPESYEPSELVIQEIMIQKNVTREKAIDILKNPST